MKAAVLASIALLAGAAALLLLLRDPGRSDDDAASLSDSAAALQTCKNLDGIQQTTYVANCDITFMGFTVPVSVSATLFATDQGQALSLGEAGELTVCAELSISKDVLKAVDAAYAEPEVEKGIFVLSATNASPKLIPQAVPPQPIGEEPVRTEVLRASLSPEQSGSIELAPRGADIDVLVKFKTGVAKRLPIQIPSHSCPRGFEPLDDSKAMSFLVAEQARPEELR